MNGFIDSYNDVRRNSGWFVGLGIVLIILGTVAIATAVFTTLISVMVFGWLLLIGGIVQCIHSFGCGPGVAC